MYFVLINIFVVITSCCLSCSTEITSKDFSLKLIQNTLNETKDNENFVIAPYEAFKLYQEIFPSNELNEANENNAKNSKENSNEDSNEILATAMPAILKHRKIVPATSKIDSHSTTLPNLLAKISLKAKWSFNFQSRDTHKHLFHQQGSQDNTIYRDFLRKDDIFRYYHDEQLNASILQLPLNLNELKLLLILPDEWDTLTELRDYLIENTDNIDDLIKKSLRLTLVRVQLPKFHVSYKMDLKEFYEEISSKEVENYQHIHQMSNLEFNERGIGRFEKTIVLFWNAYSYLRVSPENFDINHPFLFIITNNDGIQFFGQVVKMVN